jgi:hypothetical protein
MAEKTIADAIEENARTPNSITTRDGSVTSQDLMGQIAADKYLASKRAARAGVPGVRVFKITGNSPA